MLRSIKQLYGNKLGASDGDIGQVKDFYFDDRDWTIRYLVVDTGPWLPGRKVLVSPRSLGLLDQPEKIIRVNLTRKQIEDSPAIESQKPVSRQDEEDYYRYFGWPGYWQDGAAQDIMKSPDELFPSQSAVAISPKPEPNAVHLQSTQAVNGYQLRTSDGIIGHVCDFMMDAGSWAIGQLVVKTGHRLSGEEVLIEMKNVNRISYEESTVFASLADKNAEQSTSLDLPFISAVASCNR